MTTFTAWPEPSPTSTLNINVRYYDITDEESGEHVLWDIGDIYEQALETLYQSYNGTPRDFEQATRELLISRYRFAVMSTTHHTLTTISIGDFSTAERSMRFTARMAQQAQDVLHERVGMKKRGLLRRILGLVA